MKSTKAMDYVFSTLALAVVLGIYANAAPQTDASVEQSVKKSFIYRHYLKGDHIKIKAKDGVVTLTGSVSSGYHRTLAYETASAQQAVRSVDNKLEVKPAEPAPQSDAWLTAKIKTMLLFHRSVRASKTQVESKGGAVTLRGRAENQAQKDLTAEYVRDVDGVKDVDNELTVAKTGSKARKFDETMDDSSITAQVKLTLLFHRSTSAFNTHIESRDGVVTLTGSANNTAEKDLTEKIVADVKGVKSVNNRITVNGA